MKPLLLPFVLLLLAPVPAQELPATEELVIAAREGEDLHFLTQLPPAHTTDRYWPMLVLMPEGAGDAAAAAAVMQQVGRDVAAGGFVVVVPAIAGGEQHLGVLLAELRRTHRIDQGGMHLAGNGAGVARAIYAAQQHPHQFQSLTVWDSGADDAGPLLRLPLRVRGRLYVLTGLKFDRRQHFATVHKVRAGIGAGTDVAHTLDEFHDAAATGDETRYFAILPDDSVFLGTDATERWTGAEFRAFATPYFERESAWTYVPLARHVTVAPGEKFAWFDEVLGNEQYGECRGSGVLAQRDGSWVVLQYNLTIPVPNDLAKDFVARIREHAEKR